MSVSLRRIALILSSAVLTACLPVAAQTPQTSQDAPAVQQGQPQQVPPQPQWQQTQSQGQRQQVQPQGQGQQIQPQGQRRQVQAPGQGQRQQVQAQGQSLKAHARKPRAGKQEQPAPAQPASAQAAPAPAAPLQPLTLDQMPAVPPQVSYQTGELTIIAQNSTLGDILRAVRNRTAASFDVPANATERVVGRFGPGPAREVLAILLNGSHFNYVMLGSAKDPNAMSELILTPKVGADTPANQANMGQPIPQPQQVMQEQVPGEEMNGENTADVGEENVEPPPGPDNQNAEQEGAPQGFPTQPNGQPMVKTPQQLLQELQQQQLQQQQLQQQMQQQQQGQNPQQPVVYPNPQPPQRPQ